MKVNEGGMDMGEKGGCGQDVYEKRINKQMIKRVPKESILGL